MFGLGPAEMAGILIGGLVVDVGLLWVATALLDVEVSWWRLAIATLCAYIAMIGATFASQVALVATLASMGGASVSASMFWVVLVGYFVGHLLLVVVINGLLYSPLLSISLAKGFWASILQVLLRLLLYSLIAGVVFVVLAGIQINRTAPRQSAEAPAAVART
jgi:hypothetical protein